MNRPQSFITLATVCLKVECGESTEYDGSDRARAVCLVREYGGKFAPTVQVGLS